MIKIYEEKDRATSNSFTLHFATNAAREYFDIVMLQKCNVGNVTFKRAKSGMRTTCFLHFYNHACVKGIANGCSFDTHSEAFTQAVLTLLDSDSFSVLGFELRVALIDTRRALIDNSHQDWDRVLRNHYILAAHI